MYHEIRRDVEAPVDVLWSVLVDVEHWPDWVDTMDDVELVGGGSLYPGARVRIRQRPTSRTWVVTDVEEGHAFSWRLRTRGSRVSVVQAAEPRGASSEVVISVFAEGPLGPLWAVPPLSAATRGLSREADGIAERAEAVAAGRVA